MNELFESNAKAAAIPQPEENIEKKVGTMLRLYNLNKLNLTIVLDSTWKQV